MHIIRTALMVFSGAIILVAAAGCGHEEAELSRADLQPLQVRTAAVERVSSARPIEVRGTVQPARLASVSSRVTGPVIAVLVQSGQHVRSDQPLLEIEPETIKGQVDQASGGLAQAQAAFALAERNFRRFEVLHTDGAASDLELDMARMEYERARGAVEQAQGALQAASSVAGEAVVKAPFAGRVIDTLVEVGDLATPGRPLVQVESSGDQEFWLTVREADIRRFEVGQRLGVVLDARPDLDAIDGVVREIIPSADPATHTFTVKLVLPGRSGASGLSGRTVIAGDTADRLVVPIGAVHRRGGLELVVVRAPDGTARTRAVTTGRTLDNGTVEILSGLDQGEAVVVDAAGPVADGTPLEVRS